MHGLFISQGSMLYLYLEGPIGISNATAAGFAEVSNIILISYYIYKFVQYSRSIYNAAIHS